MKTLLLRVSLLALITAGLTLLPACSKKSDTSSSYTPNISSTVSSNLSTVSSGYTPQSLAKTSSSSISTQSDPCAGISDFAVCQSNLIREYLQIGKNMLDMMKLFSDAIGQHLGDIPDGSSGTSSDNKASWSKTDSTHWSVLIRGLNGNPHVYMSVSGSTYVMKIDNSQSEESGAENIQLESTVTYTDASNWDVDVFFYKVDCSTADPGAPSKAQIRLSRASSLWTGKAMLYMPYWSISASPSCSTPTSGLAMYTDFVGNDTSTKAALYMIPSTTTDLSSISNYSLSNICTTFTCTGTSLAGVNFSPYSNNWCTTGPGTSPTWGSGSGGNCDSNTAVSGASYSASSNWISPGKSSGNSSHLANKTVSLPTSL